MNYDLRNYKFQMVTLSHDPYLTGTFPIFTIQQGM